MTIGERIKLLCDESCIKQQELAKSIGITCSALSRYISGDREPKLQNICMIADYFGVSLDWITGRSEHRTYNGFISGDDALEYCRLAVESTERCWKMVSDYSVEMSVDQLARNVTAVSFFEHEHLQWKYTVPNMIHSLVDGSWREECK